MTVINRRSSAGKACSGSGRRPNRAHGGPPRQTGKTQARPSAVYASGAIPRSRRWRSPALLCSASVVVPVVQISFVLTAPTGAAVFCGKSQYEKARWARGCRRRVGAARDKLRLRNAASPRDRFGLRSVRRALQQRLLRTCSPRSNVVPKAAHALSFCTSASEISKLA
jgi:hypothetical protein